MLVAAGVALIAARRVYVQRQIDSALAIANRVGAQEVSYDLDAWPWPAAAIRLNLRGSAAMNDNDLTALADLPVDEIDLSETGVTEDAIESFRHRRPNALIKR